MHCGYRQSADSIADKCKYDSEMHYVMSQLKYIAFAVISFEFIDEI